ncbi:MAG: glycosyltransferase [Planctomycetes bacterium]|nr:glycosyltransferase [Planctomycetota bacterium]
MRVLVALDARFDQTPDGAVWSAWMPPQYWAPYLEAFETVACVARVRQAPEVPGDWHRVDSDRVQFAPVPYYLGSAAFVRHAWSVRRAVQRALGPADAVVLHGGSQVATQLVPLLARRGRPYGVQVIGDPYDVFAPGVVSHPLRPLLRWWLSRRLRQQCLGASCVTYVTKQSLQRRYPARTDAFSTSCSDVELPPSAFVESPRRPVVRTGPHRLLMVGSLAQLYKAPDVLLDAVELCAAQGLDLQLTLIGDGRFRPGLEANCRERGLDARVRFLGQLPSGAAVREQMDRADLFVLPSRTEGLPRAMIEAMARGMPCIGSTVGGIPELLPPEDLVPPGNAVALAAKIQQVFADTSRMAQMSARNLAVASEYRQEALWGRRVEFYHELRARTENWLAARAARGNGRETVTALQTNSLSRYSGRG